LKLKKSWGKIFYWEKVYMDKMDDISGSIEVFERTIINEYIQMDRFGVYMDDSGSVYLSDMYVKEESRGQGVGGEVMGRLCEFADTNGLDIRCIPSSDDDGGGDERLMRFYGRFGFVVDSDYGCGVVSMVRKSGGNNKW
jgi:GNAT superfamily N-acetyltransferase